MTRSRRFRLLNLDLGVMHCAECEANHAAMRDELAALRREVDRLAGAVGVLSRMRGYAEPPEE